MTPMPEPPSVLDLEHAAELIDLIDDCRAQGIDPIPILATELHQDDDA